MLKRNPATDLPMTQSPDVQGVTIDFGDAPAHGRWRATSMTITFNSGRKVEWKTRWRKGAGGYLDKTLYYMPREGERVTRIQLNTWELSE
jgi:hypothetical protein